MTAKRPRRTLADRNRDAITNTEPPAPAPVATGTAKAAPAPRARRQSAPPPLPPAAGEGSPRPVTVWIGDEVWGRAKTAYLLADDDQGGSWSDWVAAQITARAADPTSLDHLDTADGHGNGRRGRTVWLTPTSLDQVRAATRALALAGRSASRSAIIAGALAAAVRDAGGTALPIHAGRLPSGPKPRS